MKYKTSLLLLLSILVLPTNLYADSTDSWWETLLRISGISAMPSSQKNGHNTTLGEVWMVDISTPESLPKRVTQETMYYSPIYHSEKDVIFALTKDSIVSIEKGFGLEHSKPIQSLGNISKLVGIDTSDSNRILVLNKDNTVGFLSINTGEIKELTYDKNEKNKKMINYLQTESRTYDNYLVYTKKHTEEIFGGTIEWNNIYLKEGSQMTVNISNCNKENCSQPTMSLDHKYVIFIKSEVD